jgi:hypothetical protein
LPGGVLVGRDLIINAELKKFMRQVEALNAGVLTFRNKYNAIPGDMPNATEVWGQSPNCFDIMQPSDTVTCDGNGDGKLPEDLQRALLFFFDNSELTGSYAFSPAEAYQIDSKSDDGFPGKGNMQMETLHLSCTTTVDPDTALYLTTSNMQRCMPLIKSTF